MGEERIKCINADCNATILPSTVLKYGGLCGGCSIKQDQAERAEYIRKNRRTVNLFEGITDPVAIIQIVHARRKHDPLIQYLPPPRPVEELYGSLDDAQAHALLGVAVDAMIAGDQELSEEIGKHLSVLTDQCLDPLLEVWLDRGELWPSILFRSAGHRIRDRVVAMLEKAEGNVGHFLSALAWIGGVEVERLFRSWEAHPPAWRSALNVGPAGYAHVAGWEPGSHHRHQLFHDSCLGISVEQTGQIDPAVQLMRATAGKCPWCTGPLVHLVELNTLDPRLGFLGSVAPTLPVLTCDRCTCFTEHLFARVDEDGHATWHPGNRCPQWLPENLDQWIANPWRGVPISLKPRRAIQAADWCMQLPMSQIGGLPGWVQDSSYPICPDCGQTMRFVAQIDNSQFAHEEGVFYAFLCAECRTTATAYQQS